MRSKITRERLAQIIKEEMSSVKKKSSIDHKMVKDVVTHASKLLGAVEGFSEHATDTMKNAMTPHLDAIKRALEDMVSTPGSYVKAPTNKKVVSLRKIDTDKVV